MSDPATEETALSEKRPTENLAAVEEPQKKPESTPETRSSTANPILLKKEFPMTHRRAFKKSFWLFAIFGGIALIALGLDTYWVQDIQNTTDREVVRTALVGITAISFLVWFLRLVFFEIERLFYDYRVEGGNLHVSKGIILKEKGSFPLSRITDIYLHRGVGDFFWGISSLHVSTPTASSGRFAYIHGLTKNNADKLRVRLEELVKEQDFQIENIGGYVAKLSDRSRRRSAKKNGAKENLN